MNTNMNFVKFISLALLVAVFCCKSVEAEPLRIKNGKFRIAQFTDLHYGEDEFTPWGPIQDVNSDHVMHSVLKREEPDFVLFTGDTLTGNNIDYNATEYWDHAVSPCIDHVIPWAHVLGNHDDLSQHDGDRLTLLTHDMEHPLSHSVLGPSYLPGVTNYFIPIYGEKSDEVAALIYLLDSGGGKVPERITSAHIAWLHNTYYTNLQTYGPVPSILAFHIPVPEFEDLYNSGNCLGWLNNTILYIQDAGLFKSILSLPNILLITTGHYHENDFCCPTQNKLFCQGRHSGYGGYSTIARGSRIVEFHNSSITTWIRMEDGQLMDKITVNLKSEI